MFDTIEIRHTCSCGSVLEDYQTKVLGNILETYRLGQKVEIPELTIIVGSFEIHDYCSNCQKTIEGRAYIKDQLLARITEIEPDRSEKLIAEYVPGKIVS